MFRLIGKFSSDADKYNRPQLDEVVFQSERVRVADVVTSRLHRDNRDSRVLISAWVLWHEVTTCD